MSRYRLEYIETRRIENGKVVNIPVDQFSEPIRLDFVSDDYIEADRMRCELCSSMNFGFIKIVEE